MTCATPGVSFSCARRRSTTWVQKEKGRRPTICVAGPIAAVAGLLRSYDPNPKILPKKEGLSLLVRTWTSATLWGLHLKATPAVPDQPAGAEPVASALPLGAF